MPPRSLEESLQALLTLDLIECMDAHEPPRTAMRALPLFGTRA